MDLQLAKYGAGHTVVMQKPKPGTKVPIGSTVQVYLSSQNPDPSD
jgi:beta-lactam-binding protein with PASTA domain